MGHPKPTERSHQAHEDQKATSRAMPTRRVATQVAVELKRTQEGINCYGHDVHDDRHWGGEEASVGFRDLNPRRDLTKPDASSDHRHQAE